MTGTSDSGRLMVKVVVEVLYSGESGGGGGGCLLEQQVKRGGMRIGWRA